MPVSWLCSRWRRVTALGLLSGVLGLAPAEALAAPPVLEAVGHSSGRLTASWSLPPGVKARVIEAAISPETSRDGYFLDRNLREFDTLRDSQTSFAGSSALPAGTYYVHVAGYDASCLECPIREFSRVQELVIPPGLPTPLPTLTAREAKSYIRTALRREFRGAYRHGHAKRIAACARRSRVRVSCRRVSWAIGDLSYRGRATIWLTREAGDVAWNYAYTIKRTNEHCVATGGRSCTKTYRVR